MNGDDETLVMGQPASWFNWALARTGIYVLNKLSIDLRPRIVVQDYYGNQVLASTEDLLSTSGWRELLADFTAGPQTRLIKGTFWLDDVKLTPVTPSEVDH